MVRLLALMSKSIARGGIMIESEAKRQQIKTDISYWCDRVKATPLLRTGDIEGLVQTILEEFYHTTFCCGHLGHLEDGVHIAFKDFIVDRGDMEHGGGMGDVSGLVCRDCAEKYKKELGAWEI